MTVHLIVTSPSSAVIARLDRAIQPARRRAIYLDTTVKPGHDGNPHREFPQ